MLDDDKLGSGVLMVLPCHKRVRAVFAGAPKSISRNSTASAPHAYNSPSDRSTMYHPASFIAAARAASFTATCK